MGQEVPLSVFTRADRARYRLKVRRCLDVFAQMLDDLRFDAEHPMTGLELELNLVNGDLGPAMCNAEILADLSDRAFQAELGQFNLELNVPPRLVAGAGFESYQNDIVQYLSTVDAIADKYGARHVQVGTLPTLAERHAVLENLSNNPRYRVLNDQIVAARGEDIQLDIRGIERLRSTSESIAAEAGCTSVQFHLQVAPEDFARYWNAAQAMAGVQVAVGANSPYLFHRRLWAETRIALFEQATDTRSDELKAQGVRPRVWFGERWITSIFDLFEENVRYFPALLPICHDEDPVEVLAAGGIPTLAEMRLHNGTIYRWNRPVYDVTNGRPHLRVENRTLPAGPTVVDVLANAAFYLGLVRGLAERDRPVWSQLTFGQAEQNFHEAARYGITASQVWPGRGEVPATTLVLDELLPLAEAGLDRFGLDPGVRNRLLAIVEGRCRTGRNGATWQVATVESVQHRFGLRRPEALAEMLRRYVDLAADGAPVHTWPVD